jgi:hypothetical protein
VALRRGMNNNDTNKNFLMNNKYTFGIDLTGDDRDFTAE